MHIKVCEAAHINTQSYILHPLVEIFKPFANLLEFFTHAPQIKRIRKERWLGSKQTLAWIPLLAPSIITYQLIERHPQFLHRVTPLAPTQQILCCKQVLACLDALDEDQETHILNVYVKDFFYKRSHEFL